MPPKSTTTDGVTVFFEKDHVRQGPMSFDNYRSAITAVMETLPPDERETAIIHGKWIIIDYHEIAHHHANINRMKLRDTENGLSKVS